MRAAIIRRFCGQKKCQSPVWKLAFRGCGRISFIPLAGYPDAGVGAVPEHAVPAHDSGGGAGAGRCCCQLRNLFSSSRAWVAFRSCTGGAGLACGCDQPREKRELSVWLTPPCGQDAPVPWPAELRQAAADGHQAAEHPHGKFGSPPAHSPVVADEPQGVRCPEESEAEAAR